MRKYSLLVLAVALLFALMMVAQTGSSSGQTGQSGTNPESGASSAGSQSGTSSMGSQSGTSSTSSMSEKNGKAKTVEGCVVKEQTDYILFPKKGQPMRVSGQELSAHVGHHVKLHGTEENASGMASNTGTTGGTSGAAASGSMGQSGSASGTSGTSGSMAGNTGQSSSSSEMGSGSSSASSNLSNKELIVDRVDMISETCPANIQQKINSSGMGSSSNQSKPY